MNLSPWYCPLCHAVLAWLRLMAPMARCVSFENSLMVSCRCERLEDGYWWKALGDFWGGSCNCSVGVCWDTLRFVIPRFLLWLMMCIQFLTGLLQICHMYCQTLAKIVGNSCRQEVFIMQLGNQDRHLRPAWSTAGFHPTQNENCFICMCI